MTEAIRMIRPPELDEPVRRLVWIVPAAIAIWTILLSAFSVVLMQTKAPPVEMKPIEARLVEIPPEVRGLQSAAQAHAAPQPIVKPHPIPVRKPSAPAVKKEAALPPVIRSPYGTAKTTNAPTAEPPPASGTETGTGEEGAGSASGIGTDSLGARAIYAPTPTIPDDLREDVMETEAIAHFNVSFDGTSEVTLTKPTSNPRLNQVLLDTLKQWKFFPAVKNGVALASSFDVRIPISVK